MYVRCWRRGIPRRLSALYHALPAIVITVATALSAAGDDQSGKAPAQPPGGEKVVSDKNEKSAPTVPSEKARPSPQQTKTNATQPAQAKDAAENAGAKNADNEKPIIAAPPQPVPRVPRVAPPRGVIIRGGFRGRLGPSGMIAAGEGDVNYALFPTNRELVRQLERGAQLIDEQRFADAFQVLDDILGEKQDFFYQPNRDEQLHKSLKAEARRLINKLPADALAQYDLQFGATAKQLLDKATAEGDFNGLAGVVRRYFNTKAGCEAAWLLGRQHLDHGQTLAAALTFQMIYDSPQAKEPYEPALSLTLATCWVRAGLPARAELVLRDLRKAGSRPRFAQKEVPLFTDDAKAVSWLIANTGAPPETAAAQLAQWALHRGDPARNAASSGGSPLLSTPRWQQSLSSEPKESPASDTMSKQLVDANQIDLPAETPLAVGDTAIVRSPRWLVGVNLRSGKRIWEYETWDSENHNPRQQVMNPMTGGMITIVPEKLATRTTIASDGRAVFVVEDRGNQPFVFPGMFNPFGRGLAPGGPGSYNKLLARELATQGKLLWEVGGESGESEPRLAGVYFLGAALAMGGQVYVIGELKGEITLFVLDAANGRLDWSQPLATVEMNVALDSFRRLHGAMPSFADGVMVCPTSAGAVVAVDLANRSLLWGYQYPRNQLLNLYNGRRSGEVSNPFAVGRWTDGSIILASGRALITPPDSDQLHCVNLIDGKLAWKVERKDNLYIGGVYRDTVLVVGRRDVQGLRISDGVPAWPSRTLAGENSGVPSGRGFMSAGHYYLPLSSAEVVKIDMTDGSIKARAKSRKGYVPGNLVCYQGNVLSLNEDSLDCYFQLDEREQWAAETLRSRPDDPDALAMFGEILVDQGQVSEGMAQLSRAFELAPNERVRELLIGAHLELLRRDFANHRAQSGEIEKLLTEPAQKAAFARQMAIGLQEAGETMAAFDYYVKMCQPGEHTQELETVIPNQLSVRRDRWVGAKIAELRSRASADDRRQMDERIEAHFLEQGGPANLGALRQHLQYFGNAESAGSLASALVERLIQQNEHLEAEWWLLRQARSTNKREAADAYLCLAEWMKRLNRPDDAASCIRRHANVIGDQPAAENKTGKQALEAIAADASMRQYLAADRFWPQYVVKNEVIPRSLDSSGVQLEVSFGRQPFFEHLTIEMDTSRLELLARNGYGGERFRVGLSDARRSNGRVNYTSAPWARANGHILLVQERSQILAVDALAAERDGKSRVLWRHELADLLAEGGGVVMRSAQGANRRTQPRWVDQNNQPIGGIWPVGYELVCVQRGNKLLGIDVFSGQVLWTRHDMRPADEIFGDEEYLFVVPPSSGEGTVLRTRDGAKLGTRRIPANDRYLTYGRKVVTFSNQGGKNSVVVYDAWAEEELWRRQFAANAKIESIDSDDIAVLDTSGKFVVYSLEDAAAVIDTDIDKEASLADLVVFRTPDRYVALAARQITPRSGMAHMYGVQNGRERNVTAVQGRVFGFDRRTGKLLWENEMPPTATLTNQPAHVPLLVFAMNVTPQTPNPGAKGSIHLLCLDTRDGRIIYKQKLDNLSTSVVAVADPEAKTLEIRCSSATARLTFGDKQPVENPADNNDAGQAGAKTVDSKAGKAQAPTPASPDADPFAPK